MLKNLERTKGIVALKSLSVLLHDKKVKPYICWDNDKNFVFRYLYSITDAYVIEVLSELTIEDLEEVTMNRNPKYPKRELFVFSKEVVLLNADAKEVSEKLYIKLSIDEKGRSLIVISFHDAKYSF